MSLCALAPHAPHTPSCYPPHRYPPNRCCHRGIEIQEAAQESRTEDIVAVLVHKIQMWRNLTRNVRHKNIHSPTFPSECYPSFFLIAVLAIYVQHMTSASVINEGLKRTPIIVQHCGR